MKILKHITLIILLISFISCQKYLDKAPLDSINTANFFKTEADAVAAIVGGEPGGDVRLARLAGGGDEASAVAAGAVASSLVEHWAGDEDPLTPTRRGTRLCLRGVGEVTTRAKAIMDGGRTGCGRGGPRTA